MLKIRRLERLEVIGFKLLRRVYIIVLENKELFFCVRKVS